TGLPPLACHYIASHLTCATMAACSSPQPCDSARPPPIVWFREADRAWLGHFTETCHETRLLPTTRSSCKRKGPSQRRAYVRHAGCPAPDRTNGSTLVRRSQRSSGRVGSRAAGTGERRHGRGRRRQSVDLPGEAVASGVGSP